MRRTESTGRVLCALLSTAVLLTGCGGEEVDPKVAYVEQATGVCDEAQRAFEALPTPTTPEGFAPYANDLVGILETAQTELSWGICAERSALAAMVTAGEYRIDTVVAVWRDEGTPDRRAFVLPPCGHCREFMRALDPANLDARVLLSRTAGAPLRDLLPQHGWPQEPLPRSFG